MFAIQKYLALMPNASIWLETGAHNVPAISLYEKLGFKKLGYSEGNERLFMKYEEPA
jgi:ribosomal protein S18 acetylase RimI-like enzyme